jgi:BON domain-containing protein
MTLNAPWLRIAGPRRARRARSRFGISRAPLTVRGAHATRPTAAVAAAFALALGALLEFFLDPSAGRRRRHTARDRIISKLRRSERRAVTRARRAEARTVGIFLRTLNARHAPTLPPDDVALAHKVETDLFRRARVPKGSIDVNAEDGAVFLRGVVERHEDIERVAAVAERITGVRRVENLLHLPGTPAPPSRPKLVRDRAT